MDMITQSQSLNGAVNLRRPGITLARMAIIILVVIGYISTLPLGPEAKEVLQHFGYDPSWVGVNVMFMGAGYLGIKSLHRHGSGLKLLKSRFLRNGSMLVLFALLVVFFAYPIWGNLDQSFAELTSKLGQYFISVVTCVDPSALLPGLLDDSKYMCLVQGSIWTFRWGIIAYIALAMGWHIKLLQSRTWLTFTAISAIFAYTVLMGLTVWEIVPYFEMIITGLRLGSMFCIGACAYVWREQIIRSTLFAASLLIAILILYFILPWTPLIEVVLSLFWGYLAYLLFTTNRQFKGLLSKIPDLSVETYVFHWPVAQFLLLTFPEIGSIGLIALALPVTLIIAWIFNLIVTTRVMPIPMRKKAAA